MSQTDTANFIMRPVQESDFDAFLELATLAGGQLTNIPRDPDVVRRRIDESIRAFSLHNSHPGSHRYLFFLEDSKTGEIAGTSGIIANIGGTQPFYSYRIEKERFTFPPLKIDHEIELLRPNISKGNTSEICCLFLRPEYRKSGLGRLLSLSRFHFIATFQNRFDTRILAELRGFTELRSSPFWDAVASHFFKMDFREADYLSSLDDKEFIARLLPNHPIQLPLLPQEAIDSIAKPHRETVGALKLLLGEGFQYHGEVDIFDAGPILEAPVSSIRSIQKLETLTVDSITDNLSDSKPELLSNGRIDFRATIGSLKRTGNTASIAPSTALALNIKIGEKIAASPLYTDIHTEPEELIPPFQKREKLRNEPDNPRLAMDR